ncbi:MAG: hypothetical protein M9921_09260 [Fimbriimonadaceae bacterium]|nr:hypothetical protein [Fimbriimonadaceae bacterium]
MRIRLLSLATLLALSAVSFGADKDVEALLAKMTGVYKSAKSAKFTTHSIIPGPLGEAEVITEVSYLAPNKIYAKVKGFEAAGAAEVTFRTDGKKMVVEGLPTGKVEQNYDVQMVVQALPVNLETLNFWDWKRQLSTAEGGNMKQSTFKIVKGEKWKGSEWTVLEETAKEQNVFVRYFIDPKTFLMMRTVVSPIDDKTNIQMDVRIDKMELGAKVDPSLFKITD